MHSKQYNSRAVWQVLSKIRCAAYVMPALASGAVQSKASLKTSLPVERKAPALLSIVPSELL
jgi:hypothetical protein